MAELVKPVRYEAPKEAIIHERRDYGFKRWMVVVILWALSFYMNSIDAIGYSSILFLAGLIVLIALSLYMVATKPRGVAQDALRKDLLKRWEQ